MEQPWLFATLPNAAELLEQAKTLGESRSPEWPKVRAAHLVKEPVCQVCSSKLNLNVHHKKPFHLFPELELVDANLITLCEGPVVNCHFLYGHLRDWSAYNPDVVTDVQIWHDKLLRKLSGMDEDTVSKTAAP